MYDYKEVYFNEYCKTCRYWDIDDVKDPCNECLGEPANLHSHKPVHYEADEKKVKANGGKNETRRIYERNSMSSMR